MGSSAQIRFGVRRCGSQAQVPEGSRGFCKVPVCAGAGSGGKFWTVPSSERFWRFLACAGAGSGGRCRFRRQVLEAGSGHFRKVPEGFGRCWRVPESSGVLAGAKVPEGLGRFGGFRRAKQRTHLQICN